MAYSLIAPKKFLLKLNIHCRKCERKLKNLLVSMQGVDSVDIDLKQGNVIIGGTIDPSTIIMMLEKVGRKAELLWEEAPSGSSTASVSAASVQNLQIISQPTGGSVDQFNDPELVSQLQQLSLVDGLKNVEITYSKIVRLSFKGQKDEITDKKIEIASVQEEACKPEDARQGTGICSASASCCGGHAANNHYYSRGCTCYCHWPAPAPPAFASPPPPSPAPSWPAYAPSAPPLNQYGYDEIIGRPMGYSYSSFLSDDNPNGCSIL